MKRVVLATVVAAASAVFALDIDTDTVDSSNVLGLLPVFSPNKRTVVSVPWCAMSNVDDQSIQISNVVKTANLTVGDTLHRVNSQGTYDTWKLAEGAGGVKYWQSVNQALETGTDPSPASDTTTIARGNCIVLIRQGDLSLPFYLYGQVGTNTSIECSIVAGTATAPTYTLVSAPKPEAWSINDVTWNDVNENDKISILLNSGKQLLLSWKESEWGRQENKTAGGMVIGKEWVPYDDAIPAGIGVWYISYGGSPTITWTGIPVK